MAWWPVAALRHVLRKPVYIAVTAAFKLLLQVAAAETRSSDSSSTSLGLAVYWE